MTARSLARDISVLAHQTCRAASARYLSLPISVSRRMPSSFSSSQLHHLLIVGIGRYLAFPVGDPSCAMLSLKSLVTSPSPGRFNRSQQTNLHGWGPQKPYPCSPSRSSLFFSPGELLHALDPGSYGARDAPLG